MYKYMLISLSRF